MIQRLLASGIRLTVQRSRTRIFSRGSRSIKPNLYFMVHNFMTYILSFPFPKILNAGIHSLPLSHVSCFVELQENYHKLFKLCIKDHCNWFISLLLFFILNFPTPVYMWMVFISENIWLYSLSIGETSDMDKCQEWGWIC